MNNSYKLYLFRFCFILLVCCVQGGISCSPELNNVGLRYIATMPTLKYDEEGHSAADLDYAEVCDEVVHPDILKKANGNNIRVLIRRNIQRGQLFINGEVAMDFPVCLGKQGKQTPTGTFRIREKNVKHISNLYGASMPYFMRLTDSGIGMHVGPVFREPQSHGCIRIAREVCVPLYNIVRIGTPVDITP